MFGDIIVIKARSFNEHTGLQRAGEEDVCSYVRVPSLLNFPPLLSCALLLLGNCILKYSSERLLRLVLGVLPLSLFGCGEGAV